MPTRKWPTEHTAYSHEDEFRVGLRLDATNLIPCSLPETRFWRRVGLVKFFLFFRAAVTNTYCTSIEIGHGATLSEWEKRGSHISDRGCRGGGGVLVCICMSAVGHSMTCGMNRKCVEDTSFITWKLSALEFRAHHPVSCLVGGSVRQRLCLGLRGGAEFVSRFEDRLHSEWGFCGLPQSLQASQRLKCDRNRVFPHALFTNRRYALSYTDSIETKHQ